MIDFWIFPLSTIWGAYQNQGFEAILNRARDRNRTGTVSLQQDFKSCASASSATRAYTLYTGAQPFAYSLRSPGCAGSKKSLHFMDPFLLHILGGEGFEPSKALPADLQSVPFGHSGIHPYEKHDKSSFSQSR